MAFTWNGSEIVMCTSTNAPKLPSLRANPAIALTIDTEVHPPKIRGHPHVGQAHRLRDDPAHRRRAAHPATRRTPDRITTPGRGFHSLQVLPTPAQHVSNHTEPSAAGGVRRRLRRLGMGSGGLEDRLSSLATVTRVGRGVANRGRGVGRTTCRRSGRGE
ncbi:hypothetical protein [Allokutzneria sp. A3M-2-11 16]|uniref:hypothetical protein n=1 Tax=Allokutzneria sp. A3M-2-11 16 TaxID=2962043 RepID=UPI003F8D4693